MDFSGLVKGVQDFWDFIWPPIFCLVALVGTTSYVAPLILRKMWSKMTSWRPTDQRQIQFVKVSKRFGFDKLLPIICAFVMIFLLDVVRNIVVMGGQAIPPVISYAPSALLLDRSSNSTIQCLWMTRSESIHLRQEATITAAASAQGIERSSPRDTDPNHLDMQYGFVTFENVSQIINAAAADAEVQHKDSEPVKSLHYAQDEIGTPHMVFSALKFLFVATLVLAFFELRLSTTRPRVLLRSFIFLGILSVGMLGYFLRYLKAIENVEDQKGYVARTYPLRDSMNCEGFDVQTNVDLAKLYDRTVTRENSLHPRWWSLHFPDTTILAWSWGQLRGPKPKHPSETHP